MASRGDAVQVAVHLRPLVARELEEGCQACLSVTPGEPQASPLLFGAAARCCTSWAAEAGPAVSPDDRQGGGMFTSAQPRVGRWEGPTTAAALLQVGQGPHMFTYDHVFGEGGQEPALLFDKCVAPLVDGLFRGYNATVGAGWRRPWALAGGCRGCWWENAVHLRPLLQAAGSRAPAVRGLAVAVLRLSFGLQRVHEAACWYAWVLRRCLPMGRRGQERPTPWVAPLHREVLPGGSSRG